MWCSSMIPFEIQFDEKSGRLRICLPEGLALVEQYLEDEVYTETNKRIILERIDSVSSGKEEVSEGTGNLYSTEIRRDFTRIYNSYLEEQLERGIDTGEPIESIIETKVFAELISIWVNELNEFRNRRKM